MSSALATMAAAVVGSAPGWVGIYLADRRGLRRQTDQITQLTAQQTSEIKQHLTEAATAPTAAKGEQSL